ncbi:MAG: hypothetical protein ACI4NF_03700, partial [Christensenellales bacterium]
ASLASSTPSLHHSSAASGKKTKIVVNAMRQNGFGSNKASPDGVAGAEPPASIKQKASFVHSSAASGAAQPPRPQGASFRRKREPRGAGGEIWCKRHALKRVWFG